MNFIRPEAQALLARWREAIGALIALLGLYWTMAQEFCSGSVWWWPLAALFSPLRAFSVRGFGPGQAGLEWFRSMKAKSVILAPLTAGLCPCENSRC